MGYLYNNARLAAAISAAGFLTVSAPAQANNPVLEPVVNGASQTTVAPNASNSALETALKYVRSLVLR